MRERNKLWRPSRRAGCELSVQETTNLQSRLSVWLWARSKTMELCVTRVTMKAEGAGLQFTVVWVLTESWRFSWRQRCLCQERILEEEGGNDRGITWMKSKWDRNKKQKRMIRREKGNHCWFSMSRSEEGGNSGGKIRETSRLIFQKKVENWRTTRVEIPFEVCFYQISFFQQHSISLSGKVGIFKFSKGHRPFLLPPITRLFVNSNRPSSS